MSKKRNWENEGEEWKSQAPSSFFPGDKVVCIDDAISSGDYKKVFPWYKRQDASIGDLIVYPAFPKKGRVYVVRRADDTVIYLVGVVAGETGEQDEVGFRSCRFMLLSEYREAQRARNHKCGFWKLVEEMEAFQKELDSRKKNGEPKQVAGRKKQQPGSKAKTKEVAS